MQLQTLEAAREKKLPYPQKGFNEDEFRLD